MMKNWMYALLLLIVSCKEKKACEYATAKQLDEIDLESCTTPGANRETVKWQKFYGLPYNSFRKENGIPALPSHYYPEVFTVTNQVRWHGDINKDRVHEQSEKPFLKWKTLEWNNDTLKYDYSLFVLTPSLDRYGPTVSITYYLDTLHDRKKYSMEYMYNAGRDKPDSVIDRATADSILRANKIEY